MDLEPQRSNQLVNLLSTDAHFTNMISVKDFQLKRVVRYLNKYVTRTNIFDEFVQLYENTQQVLIRINLLAIFQYFLTHSPDLNLQIEERNRWIIINIYLIRQNLDRSNYMHQEKLEYLNKLLITFNNLASYLSTKESANKNKISQKSILLESVNLIFALQQQRHFNNANNLFQANLFLKIIELNPSNFPLNEILMNKVIYHLSLVQQQRNNLDQMTREILLNTYLKSIKNINYYTYFLQRLDIILQIFPNRLNLRLIYEAKIFKIEYISTQICQNESEFELLTLIVANFSQSSPWECQKLSQIWINNLFHLIMRQCQLDLQTLVNLFDENILTYIYSKINQMIQIFQQQEESKNAAVQIWALFLLTNNVFHLVVKNKFIAINVKVSMYRFQREILRIIPFSINPNLSKIILNVFSQYYSIILKQDSQKNINEQTIRLIIQNFPQIVNQSLLIRANNRLIINPDIIDFNNYDLTLLGIIAKKCRNQPNIGRFLATMDSKVSKIILKYIIQTKLFALSNLLSQDEIIMHTIQNDIQLHLDKYEHILQSKFYENIDKYLSLVSNRKIQNKYRRSIITCLLNLLINQKEPPTSNRKLININAQILIFIIENLDLLIKISGQQNIMKPSQLYSVLLCLAIRSLYYNIPLLVNYFIVAIILANKQVDNQTLNVQMVQLAQQLIKFSKMYSSQKQYQLIGLATYLFVASRFSNSFAFVSILQQHSEYCSTHITLILREQAHHIESMINFQAFKIKNSVLLKKVFLKCLNLSLILYSSFLFGYEQKHSQVKQIYTIIDQLINKEINEIKDRVTLPVAPTKKRSINKRSNSYTWQSPRLYQYKDWLSGLLKDIIQYDELQQFKELSTNLQVNKQTTSRLSRVYGKIRTIIRINK